MNKPHETCRKRVAVAKGRLTRARNRGESLSTLIDLRRKIDAERERERVLFQYQHSLEDAGIDDVDKALAWLREQGADVV